MLSVVWLFLESMIFITVLIFDSFLFVIVGGVGMVSLPFDLIDEYVHKPKPIEEKEFARRK